MKLKSKIIVLLLTLFAMLLVVPSIVNATTVEYTRTIPSNDGTIKINFAGLNLDATKAYEFALVRQGGTPETWFSIEDGYTATTATVILSSTKSAIVDVLKVTDTGFIYIREKDDTTGSYVLEAKQVDLTLPYLQSISYTKENNKYNVVGMLYGSIGNSGMYTGAAQTYIAWEKVTNENFVEAFLNVKNNQGNIITLESNITNPPSANNFIDERNPSYADKNDGLYLLWVMRTGTKTVISCIIHDGLPEATKVNQYIQSADLDAPKMETLEIENTSALKHDSETGYYFVEVGATITIKATFDETLQGNTAPTLKIKCGNGEEITVPAGTITGEYIVWNYTIKEQDKGVIAAISLAGGNVADEAGNAVTSYTCPVLEESIWGSLVYANGTGTETEPEEDDGEWTDFSKAKFELKKDGTSGAILEITGVTPKDGSEYYLFITSNSNKPNVTSSDENKIYLSFNSESKKFNVVDMAKYIELNQDIYVSILENQSYENEKIVLFGKKLERYAEPKYSDAFFATFMTHDTDQIVTTFTHDADNNRKIQIKIGKITDASILQKIKNQDISGFASLLAFSKTDKGMYDKLVDATKNDYAISYDAGAGTNTGYSVIGLEGLQDEAYYFLYVKTYDEDGKYISNEAVTLAQASVHEDGKWYLFFYGDEDFEWADFGDVEDDTKAPVKLPDTGKFTIISILAVTAVAGAVSFIKTKKYKGI